LHFLAFFYFEKPSYPLNLRDMWQQKATGEEMYAEKNLNKMRGGRGALGFMFDLAAISVSL